MDQRNALHEILADLSAEDCTSLDEELEQSLLEAALDSELFGLALAAPPTVKLSENETLPLLLLRCTTGQRDWEVELRPNTRLLGVNLTTGEGKISHAFPPKKARAASNVYRSRVGPPPDEINAESTGAGFDRFDARQLLGLPWKPGRWAFTIISHDWRSNTVEVDLEGDALGPLPGFSRDRALMLGRIAKRAEDQPRALPRFSPIRETPIIDEEGAALSAPEAVVLYEEPFVVHGALRIPMPEGAIVARSPQEQGAPPHEASEDPELPAAVLRALLFLTRLDEPEPAQALVQIPIYTEIAPQADTVVDACFSLDLNTVLRELPQPGPYLIYLAAGGHLSSPVITTGTRKEGRRSER